MNLVDSSAWLSYLAGDRNAGTFGRAIEDTARLLVPTVVLLEVFKAVVRQRGEDEAIEIAAHMQQGQVVALDTELALNAAALGLEHDLPLADSIIYATARRFDATLWTQDRDFEGLPGVRYLA
jgi:toxin FitB